MHCCFCGKQLENNPPFCYFCGKNLLVNNAESEQDLIKKDQKQNKKKGALKKLGKLSKITYGPHSVKPSFIMALVVVLSISFVFIYGSSKKQTASLTNQINEIKKQTAVIQQQAASTTKTISSQLNEQKTKADNAEKQAQLAQQALSAIKQQIQSTPVSSSGFPTINTDAIVLIVCGNGSGSLQSGSGTIIDATGRVLTNKHVVTDDYSRSLTCVAFMNTGGNSPQLKKDVYYNLSIQVGFYTDLDAILLKIDSAQNTQNDNNVPLPKSFPFIKPQGGSLKQGDALYVFGYPAASEFVFNVTRGIVSSFSPDGTFINTDTIIDHGNSGGAAITSDGRFVGIPTQRYTGNGDYLGQILKVENLYIPN